MREVYSIYCIIIANIIFEYQNIFMMLKMLLLFNWFSYHLPKAV